MCGPQTDSTERRDRYLALSLAYERLTQTLETTAAPFAKPGGVGWANTRNPALLGNRGRRTCNLAPPGGIPDRSCSIVKGEPRWRRAGLSLFSARGSPQCCSIVIRQQLYACGGSTCNISVTAGRRRR
jgi:hypothetical protein